MTCSSYQYSNHAITQMFRGGISADEVEATVSQGEKINDYPYDKPYPSCLLLHFVNGKAIHVVVSRDSGQGTCYIITTYLPDPAIWSAGFRTKI